MQHQHLHIPTQGIDINTDVTTWALPERAIARLGRGACFQFAISPDRRYLAVGTLIGVWWYELSTLSPIALWETERGVISALDFSPNGKRHIRNIYFSKGITWNRDSQKLIVVFTSVRDINVWTLDNPNSVVTASIDTASVESVAFSPDGQTLASVSRGGFSTCWEVAKKQARQQHLPTKVHTHFFLPNGNIHALGSVENRVYVWDVETKETIATLSEHSKKVNTAAYSHTSKVWATGDIAGNLYVSDGKGKQITLSGHTNSIESLAFSPNGSQLVSASGDKTVRVWDILPGKEVAVFPLTQLDAELYLGDPHQKQRLIRIQHNRTQRGDTIYRSIEIKAIAFSPCGDIIAGGLHWEIRLWDAATYDIRAAILLPRECESPYALAFSPCGRYLASGSWWAGTEKVSIRLWDLATCENIHTFWGHPTDVQDLAFSPDGALLASGSADGTVLLWDMKSITST